MIKNSLIDVDKIRIDFPILSRVIGDKPLVYLDNGATTQKPLQVIDRVRQFDTEEYANIHRGSYKLGERSTELYHSTREKVAKFIGSSNSKEIIFTSGTTQSINLVAHSYGRSFIKEGDEIIISHMEHHANIVPWQVLCDEVGAILKVIPINDDGEIIIEEYKKLLSKKTKMVAITYISNSLGTINPVKDITAMAHSVGAKVLIDGAQSTPHTKVDVKDIDCDFYCFSGHKMFAPTGVGVLYGKFDLLNSMPPYITGGDMINYVSFEKKTTYNKPPSKFEAGTPPISQVIGLGTAIDYLNNIGMDNISLYERELLKYATNTLSKIPELKIIGTAKHKASIISFVLDVVHPHDVVTFLDSDGIACRGGHHCTQPLMQRFNIPATTRASMAFYNKFEEIDILAKSIKKVIEVFK